VVRPPLMKLTDGEIKLLGQALDAAGLLPRAAAE
jgi:hypothetical protein